MTNNELWYMMTFAWGLLCAWAVVQGMEGGER